MVGISGTAALCETEGEGCLHRHLGYSSWNSTPTGRGFDQHVGFMQGEEDYNAHTFCKSTCILNGDLHDSIVQSLIRYYTDCRNRRGMRARLFQQHHTAATRSPAVLHHTLPRRGHPHHSCTCHEGRGEVDPAFSVHRLAGKIHFSALYPATTLESLD